ncbi:MULTISPECIES: hypothetical protein [unclassified Acinetobacter]|uniref:hypothetical protein n=1 Tax=unclassified Acinetobacter TaxID=196816 RepID=UPI002934E4A8|nr:MULTISPECIES: hypothetical protein [unclassified Acinetobacter]WOE33279.1 hypothetical protein QSG84_16100 [Acinetobacter sp. SAAs470]WOE36940.1 hypothetical protein QSG86_00785 [Acinetobacter sp. SAAs474]
MKPLNLFLNELLTVESGISTEKKIWYKENFNKKVIDYYETIKPGVVKRDLKTGKPILKKLTVKEYFSTLGVIHLFKPDDQNSLKIMQYHSINALGFVGYQFGEALLYDLGFYVPTKKKYNDTLFDSLYLGGLSDDIWSEDVSIFPSNSESFGKIILATHINLWEGSFKGIDGLNYFEDLKKPVIQDKIILEAFSYNISVLKGLFKVSKGIDILDIFKENLKSDDLFSELFKLHGVGILSGVLAAMHLCGPYGFYDLYIKNKISFDEFSMSIVEYIEKFSNYDVFELYM